MSPPSTAASSITPPPEDNNSIPAAPRHVGGSASSYFSDALGRGVVNPVLRVVDVDGIIRRVDVNDLLRRVDWDELFTEEIDINKVLDQVDFDRVLENIDVNRVLDRIDINKVIEESNLKSIIARSTNGMCSHILNTLRAQIIRMDQVAQRLGRCACCWWNSSRGRWILPPKPTISAVRRSHDRRMDHSVRHQMYCPKKPTELAIAVQGRNAGFVSRLLAFSIDFGLLFGIFTLCILVLSSLAELFVENRKKKPETEEEGNTIVVEEGDYYFPPYVPLLIFYLVGVIYHAICLGSVGRTIGKVILGLLVVHSHDGKPLTVAQACCRSVLKNIPFILAAGAILSLLREDRRGVVDICVMTTVVYAWDAHNFRLAEMEWGRDMPFGDLDANTRSIHILGRSFSQEEEEYSISTTTSSQKRQRDNNLQERRPVKTRVLKFPMGEQNIAGSSFDNVSMNV